MQEVKPGDVVLYAVRVREKGAQSLFYCGEVVGSVSGGVPHSISGEPIRGVRAIYRRSDPAGTAQPERTWLARDARGADEKQRLQAALEKIYGPGELTTGFSCPGEAACSLRRSLP